MRYHLLVMQLFKKESKKKGNIILLDTKYQCVELWSSRGLSQSSLNMSLSSEAQCPRRLLQLHEELLHPWQYHVEFVNKCHFEDKIHLVSLNSYSDNLKENDSETVLKEVAWITYSIHYNHRLYDFIISFISAFTRLIALSRYNINDHVYHTMSGSINLK